MREVCDMSDNNDWFDEFMDYKMSSSSSASFGSSHSSGHSSGGTRIPTWVFALAIIGIISGDLPINGFTVFLAVIFSVIVLIRILNS